MASDIIITSDSTTDLSKELCERYKITVMPLCITLGDKLYTDGVDITPDDIYAHHDRTGELPKTTATNVGDCLDFFSQFTSQGKTVIHFTISSEMSSTYNNACMAAEELGNVYIIDTKNLSTGGGLLVITAAELLNQGLPVEEIVEKTRETVARVDASFVIDNLEYLYKGGRCSAVAMLGANLLSDKYQLSKYHSKFREIPQEEDMLKQLVLRDMYAIKEANILQQIKEVQQAIKEAQRQGDMERIFELLKKQNQLNEIKNILSKELGERIVLKM